MKIYQQKLLQDKLIVAKKNLIQPLGGALSAINLFLLYSVGTNLCQNRVFYGNKLSF